MSCFQPSQFNFHVQRTITFTGAAFTILSNGVPLDLTGASILCQFRTAPGKEVVMEWRNGDGITINNPTAGQFYFNPQVITLPAGRYGYDVSIVLSSGKRVNYINGQMIVEAVYSEL